MVLLSGLPPSGKNAGQWGCAPNYLYKCTHQLLSPIDQQFTPQGINSPATSGLCIQTPGHCQYRSPRAGERDTVTAGSEVLSDYPGVNLSRAHAEREPEPQETERLWSGPKEGWEIVGDHTCSTPTPDLKVQSGQE